MKNQPYIKKYETNENGIEVLVNPITKDTPYLHQYPTTASEKRSLKNSKNNKKGTRLVVTRISASEFVKTRLFKQTIRLSPTKTRAITHAIMSS